jgi:hypothetical protein
MMALRFSNILLPFCLLAITLNGLQSELLAQADMDSVFVKRNVGEGAFEIDTFYMLSGVSSQQVLVGTTFLPYSDKMISLLNDGLSPVSFKILEGCDNGLEPTDFNDYPKFDIIKRVGKNQLLIQVRVMANCCHNFLGEAEVLGNDTLHLVYTSYGNFCSCQCCFTLEYVFDTTFEDKDNRLHFVTINRHKSFGVIPN